MSVMVTEADLQSLIDNSLRQTAELIRKCKAHEAALGRNGSFLQGMEHAAIRVDLLRLTLRDGGEF